jgi:hypothetical protein
MAGAALMQEPTYDPRFEPPPDDERLEPPERREREDRARRRLRVAIGAGVFSLLSLAAMLWAMGHREAAGLLLPILAIVFALVELVVRIVASKEADDTGPYSSPPSLTR